MKKDIVFNKDEEASSVFVMKVFDADVSLVWKHFSESGLIDLWWAPQPWHCETVAMNFAENGRWHYAMVGPENQRLYASALYNDINFHRSISWSDFFSDELGNPDGDKPSVDWLIGFTGVAEGTKLTVNIHFKSPSDMTKILEMGFEEGFKTALNNLEDLMEQYQ